MNNTANATVRSDMSACQPGDNLTREFEDGRWQLIDYETEDGVKGVMALAAPEHDCGELTIPLDVQGPHRIYLGVNYTKTKHKEFSSYGRLAVKLTGDHGYRRVGAEPLGEHTGALKSKLGVKNEIYKSIQEAYWKTADLTGQSLSFRQPAPPYNRPEHHCVSNLSYVKLVPLSEEEVERWEAERPTGDTRRLAQLFCTGQLTGHTAGSYTFHPTDESWFRDEMVPLVDSDIGILVFEALRGSYCSYRTKIGYLGTEADTWQEEWLDPLEVFTRLCHENGMKIFASMRMIAVQYPMNRAPIARAKHFWERPQFAKRDRNGVPTTGLSLAYPEVRNYWLSLLRETLDYGTDGVQLHFNRSAPFVMYEDPVVASFKEAYGEDPRTLPEDDPRYVTHCAGLTTVFLREVRALLDEKPGRELSVTIYGRPHKYDKNRDDFHPVRYNCDVETWLEEELIDYLMPSPRVELDMLRKWRDLAGDNVHIWPDLMPRTQPAEVYAQLVKDYYEAGADGFSIWDGERRPQRLSEWAAVRLLGHKDLLPRIIEEGPGWYRRVPLAVLDGFSAQESYHDG
jgi:hypothetical protein